MQITRTFNVPFSDLEYQAQEDILTTLVEALKEEAEKEGNQYLAKKWYEPKPKTWQEAYCRTNDINYDVWQDWVNNFDNGIIGDELTEPLTEDWVEWVEEELRELAEKKAHSAFKHLEVEVKLYE